MKQNFSLKKLLLLFFLFSFLHTFSQDTNQNTTFVPQLRGIIKTKVEYDFDNKLMRFAVRNARFGAKGKINSFFSYYVQADLSDEGKIKMLDAYVGYEPIKNLSFQLGQMKIPFSTDYIRSPADNFFANRSFVAKYINQGLRDIGFVASYKAKLFMPFSIFAGLFNGSGNNNPQWKQQPNYNFRFVLGKEKEGFSFKVNYYGGDTEKETNLNILGGEVAYLNQKFLLESEIIYRDWSDSIKHQESGFYVHSYYIFETKLRQLKFIQPTVRYDFMGDNVIRWNTTDERLTLGLNFGYDIKPFTAEFRLNYENYFLSSLPQHTDKLTIEFLVKF